MSPLRILCCLLALATVVTAADPVVPRGARVLAIDVNPSASGSYDAAWTIAAGCGIQNVGLSLDWNQFETTPGTFADASGWLTIADAYYAAKGATLTLTLRPLHNAVKPVPADLAATRFEDASHTMATRFCAMLDWAMARLPNVTIEALVIGSEYDVYLNAHPSEWSDYGWFVSRVADHVHAAAYAARVPRIAAEATYAGYLSQPAGIAAINGICDVAGVSYYAIAGGFAVKDQSTVRAELDSLLPFASASKPLCFYQFGCPAAWRDGAGIVQDRSTQQADFIRTAFAFWDAHPSVVRLVDFTWLHDLPPSAVAIQEGYFGLADPAFGTFLGSLGLRTDAGAGAAKPGWTALREETSQRGWGDPLTPAPSGGGGASAPSAGGGGGGGGGCGVGGGLSSVLLCLSLLAACGAARLSVGNAYRRSSPRK